MKKLIFYLSVVFMFSFLAGCDFLDDDDDGYSLNDAWIGFGLVEKDTVSDVFSIELDNGTVLFPVTNSGWNSQVSDNQRVLVNFTILDEKEDSINTDQYIVRINSLRNILFKGILELTPAIEDSIGNDPIHVKDHWLKDNMLNFELQYRGGSKLHFINLVRQPDSTATEPVILELRHNANDDPDMVNMSAVVTFDLSSLQVEGKDSISFRVIAKDYQGVDFGYNGVYKY